MGLYRLSLQWHSGSHCGNPDSVVSVVQELSKLASFLPLELEPEATFMLSAHLALEPLNGNDSRQGFVNFLVLFSSMYKCICHVSIFVLK